MLGTATSDRFYRLVGSVNECRLALTFSPSLEIVLVPFAFALGVGSTANGKRGELFYVVSSSLLAPWLGDIKVTGWPLHLTASSYFRI